MSHSMRVLLRCLVAVYAALGLSAASASALADDDCFEQAGAYQSVNPLVLRAVAWRESRGNAGAINRNSNGSIDIGQLQINSIHFPDLARHGIPHRALTDPCVNVFVAAWLLKQKMVKYGNMWGGDRRVSLGIAEAPRCVCAEHSEDLGELGELQPAM